MATATWPDPPDTPAGTLLGAAVPRHRARVASDVSRAHAVDAAAAAEESVQGRFDDLAGPPEQGERDRGKPRVPFGAAPTRQVRRVFVAKFNPALGDGRVDRFDESDPLREPTLWDPTTPESWVGNGNVRDAPAFTRIGPGDLVFVYRGEPKVGKRTLKDSSDPMHGRPHLVGVWWVHHVQRGWAAGTQRRPVTDVTHFPLVRFDDPVRVPTIRRHPELADIDPFTDRTQASLVEADPVEAAALAAACSLPSWVLTAPDPVVMTQRLSTIRTGATDDDLRYQRDAHASYEYVHAVERAASVRVQRLLEDAGWDVISKENVPGWGADLDCVRELRPGDREHRTVEVKGKARGNWKTVVLQQSQYAAAVRSARAGDDVWWLAICTHALHDTPPPVRQVPADYVAANWPPNLIR